MYCLLWGERLSKKWTKLMTQGMVKNSEKSTQSFNNKDQLFF